MTKIPSVEDKPAVRKPPWLLGFVVFGLLVFLVLLQSSNLWKSFSVESISDTLLLYALSSLNFIAFIVLAFILVRSLIKLRQERIAFQLGSKIKTKLLFYFFAVSLLPLLAMSIFSYLYMNRALEKWFSQMPEKVIRQAGTLQKEHVENQKARAADSARVIAALLAKSGSDQQTLDLVREKGKLTAVEIIDAENRVVVSSVAPIPDGLREEYGKIIRSIRSGDFNNPSLSDGNGFDASLADFSDGRKLLIIPGAGPEGTVGELVNSSIVEFDRLKSSQVLVRRLGLTTLGLLTFLLIFASSWVAFYIAKGLTRPIRALAEGADEVARGNYSHRVSVVAEDELALLVGAFNAMTAKLEESAEELDERRRYIETILHSLSTGVISFDRKSRVTTINKAAKDMLRLENADFLGIDLDRVLTERNRIIFKRLIARAMRIGSAAEQAVLFKERTDGSVEGSEEITVALSAASLPHKNGTVLVIEDLSELASAQRAAAWQEVARRMAHEIKNPLTPIQLSAERIAKRFRPGQNGDGQPDGVESPDIKVINEGTNTILREVRSLKSMVDEFARFAKLPDVELREIKLAEVIEQAVALYDGRDQTTNITSLIESDLPYVMADDEQLKRVFVNLIDNAIESFGADGRDKQIEIRAGYYSNLEIVRIEVEDNGPGIEKADVPRLFQPYFSTKGRGTGLGLAIVNRIIRDHNGRIFVKANQPKGSTFVIEIPAQPD